MKLYLNSRTNEHSAIAEYDNDKIVVLAGSRINPVLKFKKIPFDVLQKRMDLEIVGEDGILKKDVTFNSPSAAAQFVTGRSSNGYIAWRPDNKMSLKKFLNK